MRIIYFGYIANISVCNCYANCINETLCLVLGIHLWAKETQSFISGCLISGCLLSQAGRTDPSNTTSLSLSLSLLLSLSLSYTYTHTLIPILMNYGSYEKLKFRLSEDNMVQDQGYGQRRKNPESAFLWYLRPTPSDPKLERWREEVIQVDLKASIMLL